MADRIEIVPFDLSMEPRWEAFLERNAVSSIYHSPRFVHFVTWLVGGEDRTLLAMSGDQVVGVLPAVAKNGPLGTVVNSLPFFGSNGGPLGEGQNIVDMLLDEFKGRCAGAAAATVISHPHHVVEFSSYGYGLMDKRISQTTRLSYANESDLWMSFAGAARRNVKKADAAGFAYTVENDAFPALRAIHENNMEAIGGLCKPAAFFEGLPLRLREGEDFRLYVARMGGEVAAALLLLYHGATVEYYVPAIAGAFRDSQPLSGLIYKAMLDARSLGLRKWNWGGTWLTQKGVYRFKKKWAAEEDEYFYYTMISNDDVYHSTPDELRSSYPYCYVLPFDALRVNH